VNSIRLAGRGGAGAGSAPLPALAVPPNYARMSAAALAAAAASGKAKAMPVGAEPAPAPADPVVSGAGPAVETWVRVADPGGAGHYFYHSLTRETRWEMPGGQGVVVVDQL
jgi:hypothetical protein